MKNKWTGKQKVGLGDKFAHIGDVMAEEQLNKKEYKNRVMERIKEISKQRKEEGGRLHDRG